MIHNIRYLYKSDVQPHSHSKLMIPKFLLVCEWLVSRSSCEDPANPTEKREICLQTVMVTEIPQNDSELDKRQLNTTAGKLMRFSKACIDQKLKKVVLFAIGLCLQGKEGRRRKKKFSFKTLRIRAQRRWVISYQPLLMSNSELCISPLQQADL